MKCVEVLGVNKRKPILPAFSGPITVASIAQQATVNDDAQDICSYVFLYTTLNSSLTLGRCQAFHSICKLTLLHNFGHLQLSLTHLCVDMVV